jgi:hypothetical protein
MVRAGHALIVWIVEYYLSGPFFFFLPPTPPCPPICSHEALRKVPQVTGILLLPAPDWFQTCGHQQAEAEIINTIAKSGLSAQY